MASKIKKSFNATIQGVLGIENETISVEVEDYGDVVLSDFIKDFNGKNVRLSITYSENED